AKAGALLLDHGHKLHGMPRGDTLVMDDPGRLKGGHNARRAVKVSTVFDRVKVAAHHDHWSGGVCALQPADKGANGVWAHLQAGRLHGLLDVLGGLGMLWGEG